MCYNQERLLSLIHCFTKNSQINEQTGFIGRAKTNCGNTNCEKFNNYLSL